MSTFSDDVEQAIIARYLSGESTDVLGQAYETSRAQIRRILARHQIERRKPGERPLRPDAKLYQYDPEILRQLVDSGMSIREIGRELGMASSGVHNACASLGIQLRDRYEQFLAKNCRQIPDSLFAVPLGPKESWLLGLLMTDGCANDRDHLIKLSISDKDGAQLASQIIGFGSIRERSPTTSEYNGNKIQGKLPIWSYVACSMQLVERLGAHFGCASEPFVHALHAITSKITGSSAQVRANRRKDFWKLSYSGKSAVALARWLYYEPDLPCLERKRAIVQPFL